MRKQTVYRSLSLRLRGETWQGAEATKHVKIQLLPHDRLSDVLLRAADDPDFFMCRVDRCVVRVVRAGRSGTVSSRVRVVSV